MDKRKDITAALLGVTVALILWVTVLGRDAQIGGNLFYPPFHSFRSLWKQILRAGIRSNFLGNILLFVPVGVLLPEITGSRRTTLIAGCSFSVLIELIQLITRRGCFDPDDIILNFVGCIIGYWLCCVVQKLTSKKNLNADSI